MEQIGASGLQVMNAMRQSIRRIPAGEGGGGHLQLAEPKASGLGGEGGQPQLVEPPQVDALSQRLHGVGALVRLVGRIAFGQLCQCLCCLRPRPRNIACLVLFRLPARLKIRNAGLFSRCASSLTGTG